MKTLLIAGALALMPAAALAATDLSGAWTVNGAFDSMGIKYTETCTWKQDDAGKLTGTCAPQAAPSASGSSADNAAPVPATGSVDGTKVEFAYDTTYQGSPVHLDYKGDLAPDGTLSGTIDAGAAQGTFTATRQ